MWTGSSSLRVPSGPGRVAARGEEGDFNGLSGTAAYGLARPIRFGQHALAVLAAASFGTTLVTACWTVALSFAASGRPLGTPIGTLAFLCRLSVMLVALPCAGVVLSLLWPVTRRGSTASSGICILAGAVMGIVVAPMWSPQWQGWALSELPIFTLSGAAIAACYIFVLRQLGRARPMDTKIFA